MRHENLMMVLFALVLTQYTIGTPLLDSPSKMQFIIVVIGILCILAAGSIINDIFDLHTDCNNASNMRMIDATVSKKNSQLFYYIVTVFATLCGTYAVYLNGSKGLAFLFTSAMILLYLYAKYLKRIAIVGNIFVSFITVLPIGLVFLFKLESISTSDSFRDFVTRLFTYPSFAIFGILAFCMTFIRELIQDIADINSDHALHIKTFPILIGTSRTKYVVLLLSSILFVVIQVLAKTALSVGLTDVFWYTTLFISAPFAWFLYKLYHSKKTKDFKFLSQLLKYILFFGMLLILFTKL